MNCSHVDCEGGWGILAEEREVYWKDKCDHRDVPYDWVVKYSV